MKNNKFPTLISLFVSLFIFSTAIMSCSKVDTMTIDLSGQWRFQIDSLDQGIAQKWFANSLNDSIELPGSMPLRGKGDLVGPDTKFTGNTWLQYEEGKTWMDDENYKPYLSEDKFRYPFWLISEYYYAGAAWYQKEIELPEDWIGKSIELLLERPHWETSLWVNGTYVGLQNTLGVPHRFGVGDFLQPGKNIISICVDNRVKEIKVGDDAHSVTDNTQSNWNGIVGDIKLIKKDLVHLANVQIFPDLKNKSAKLKIEINNASGELQKGKLEISAKSSSEDSSREIKNITKFFEFTTESKTIEIDYPMGENVRLWDEYDPHLYELTIELTSNSNKDKRSEIFGMRDFKQIGKAFAINDRPVFLRGTLECAIFPKTGFPPTDVEAWERIIKICQDHGLNHIRFHSWCPPEAAFVAADKLGFYYMVEASAWTAVGDGNPIDEWIYKESHAIVDAYGNHPSFVLFAYGNEPGGKNHPVYLTEFVKYWKNKDSRRLYTTAAGWPLVPENEYHSTHRGTRIQGWGEELNSVINREAPRSDYDFEKVVENLEAPMISHEIGQWCVYPNFDEMPKYDGVLRATNFEIFKRSLEAHGMLELADDFVKASGKLQALCYKADIEAALRTPGYGGFQLLDLHDFPGQGTALVGILDPFWDEKGYISSKEFRQFSNQTVPLARFKKMIFTSEEKIACDIEVAHYGKKELKDVVPAWKILNSAGEVVLKGAFDKMDISLGHNIHLGSISEDINVEKASKYQLQVEVAGFMNSWDFWVYPAKLPETETDILIVSNLNKEAISTLEKGGKVLLTAKKGSIKEGKGGEVAVGFSSIFWNTAWTNGQKPHTLGILCDPEHPGLEEFPTEYHSNWQWWDAMSHSNAISLEDFENKPEPIVRIIDDWVTNRNLALIFEAKVGNGKLLMTGIDLLKDKNKRPEARQLLYSLKNYMGSAAFDPKTELYPEEIDSLMKEDMSL